MKTPDLEYINTGLFTRFIPNTEAGETAWKTMESQEPNGSAVLTIHAKAVMQQLRKAGYSVAKAKAVTQSMDEILAELEAL